MISRSGELISLRAGVEVRRLRANAVDRDFRMAGRQSSTILVSANFGGIDRILKLQGGRSFDSVYFTEQGTVDASCDDAIRSWDKLVIPPYPRKEWHPRIRAKYFKLQIHKLMEVYGYDYLVWADSRIQIIDTDFIMGTVETLRSMQPWSRLAIFDHPDRLTISQEAEYIYREMAAGNEYLLQRYADEPMKAQLDYYSALDYPTQDRLLSGGFWIVANNSLMARCWDEWWDHNLRFSIMDQLSLPVVLNRHNITPYIINGRIWDNQFVKVGADHSPIEKP